MSILYNSNDSSVSTHLWTAIEDGKYWYGSAPNPWLAAAIRPFWWMADEALA